MLNIGEERSLVLSTLTKVLIVLLSLFSIFLCGTVVTYVGNSNNYKALYDQEKTDHNLCEAERKSLDGQYSEQLEVAKSLKVEFNDRIQLLEDEKSKMTADLRNAQRSSLKFQARADSWQGILTGFEQTIDNLENSLRTTQAEMDKLHGERVDEKRQFNQITAQLYESIVQLEALKADKMRLLEDKSGLEAQVKTLADGGASSNRNIVTPQKGAATAAATLASSVNIKGRITEVGESLISLSIGSADGVEKDMVFHVTRGDEFICDVIVTDVDTNKAAGVLELKLGQPKIGDTVSTKL